jgi:hypothetical protein
VRAFRRICALVIAVASCTPGGGDPDPGAPPSPVAPRPIASLPEDPCRLLTRAEVSVATRLRVRQARRVPDIEEIVNAGREGRAPRTSTICTYDTPGDLVAISITVPPVSGRSAAAYRSAREAYFRQYPGSARDVSGVGEDAWLGAGNTLHVLAGEHAYFIVTTRMARPNSPDVVAAVARAAIERLRR